jgi:class 3 adenylate cyclase
LILDEVMANVSSQLDDQAKLGVKIAVQREVPESAPEYRGVWWKIPQVTAVFADLKGSTALNATEASRTAALAYTYFIRAMAVVMDRFSAGYVDIQGDGIFGLFSGKGSQFHAAAAAITMKTLIETDVAVRFRKDTPADWNLTAGIGIDQGTLLVRRLGLRGTSENEVWAGTPVNTAARLSSWACPGEVVVSDRVFDAYERASDLRRRALLWSCGCVGNSLGGGLDGSTTRARNLWKSKSVSRDSGLDIKSIHWISKAWCPYHGAEYCESVATNKRPVR